MKNILKALPVALLLFGAATAATAQSSGKMDRFITRLMSKMTLEEKIGQLNLRGCGRPQGGVNEEMPIARMVMRGEVGSIIGSPGADNVRRLQQWAVEKTRLGIPLLIGFDVIHGYNTVFPIPLAMASTWDMEGIEQSARIAAREATADGVNWTYSPMVDISPDARWGRIAESAGEDPFLGATIARHMVKGYQGTFQDDNLMACVKHFALYGAGEGGRDYNTVDMSRHRMYNYFLPPYRAAVDAGVGSAMTSFNVVDGVPASVNRWLLTDLLRDEWGFRGFVVSDAGAIGECIDHGMGDLQTVSALALHAGTDMDMASQGYPKTLLQSYNEGKVSLSDIDQACRRILEAKYRLGLFDDPYRFCRAERLQTDCYTPAHRDFARRMARESFVLLKNDDHLLPLRSEGTIALIGPLADNRHDLVGCWAGMPDREKVRTLREVMAERLNGRATLLCSQGCNFTSDSLSQAIGNGASPRPFLNPDSLQQDALRIARQADIIVCAMGEEAEMSGESASRAHLELPDAQRDLLEALLQTGKPIVLLNFAGRPTVMTWEQQHLPAILNVWFGGSETAEAIADVVFGDVSPGGRLTATMPQHAAQEPLYYNHLPTGRPAEEQSEQYKRFKSRYMDISGEGLYPFGYGLTYSTVSYSDMQLSDTVCTMDDIKAGRVKAAVTIENTGNYDVDEVVQLYVRDPVASVSRPVKELKGFRRVHIRQGERLQIELPLTEEMFQFYNSGLQLVAEPGEFYIMIGPDSADKSLQRKTLTLK